jgi:hypothetical protein
MAPSALEHPRVRAPSPSKRGDVAALAILVTIATVVFGLPAMLGHAVVPGDDRSQSFPLRVLVGSDLRHGRLPLLDPYIWSGAPLLGGWNAGAAYPFTWLFAVFPGTAAWALNQVIAAATAAVGSYVFLRNLALRPLPSALGALSFTFAGAMAAQTSHFGLLAGTSWVPWLLVALLRLSRPAPPAVRLGWVAVIGGAGALCVLAGDPRAVDDAVVVVVLYGSWLALRLERGLGSYLGAVGAGALLAVGLSALQWAPGIAAVATSQRAVHSLVLFDSGSWPARWLLFLLIPDLLGGSGSFGQPSFLGSYNLTEVTGYVGILPLVAAVALPFQVREGRLPRDVPGRDIPRRRGWPEWLVWHVVALAGLVLALGGNSPIGRILFSLPLFGDQRLQSRNILVADFALAVLLAYWADHFIGLPRAQVGKHRRYWRWSEMLPASAVGVLATVALLWGAGMLRWLGATGAALGAAGALRPWIVPFLVLSMLATAMVALGRRWSRRRRAQAVASFVVADVVVFLLTSVVAVGQGLGPTTALASSARTALTASSAAPGSTVVTAAPPATVTRPVSSLGLPGRFAIYDPGLLDIGALSQLDPPDDNVLDGTSSVQGYGSIVFGPYASATGTHTATGNGQDVLSVAALRNGTLDELDTSALLTPAAYLVTPGRSESTGLARGRRLAAGSRTTWYVGSPLDVAAIGLACRLRSVEGPGPAVIDVGSVTPSGAIAWLAADPASACNGFLHLVLSGVRAAGVVVRTRGVELQVGSPVVTETSGASVVADGQLQGALEPPRWQYRGTDGPFGVFVDRRAEPPLLLRPRPGSDLAGAWVRVLTGSADLPDSAAVSSPHGVVVVRAADDIPGWSAQWTPSGGGRARPLTVRRSGLVQAVTVPAGQGSLRWSYDPPGFLTGAIATVSAAIVLLALLAWSLHSSRRRRRAASARRTR